MKSRIRGSASKKVLGLNISPENNPHLIKILDKFQIVYQPLENTMGEEQIGYLCGFKGFEKSSACFDVPLNDECLIFSGLSPKEMGLLLKDLRENKVAVKLKAIVTESNQRWTLKKLIEQLKWEYNVMNGGGKND